MRLWKFLFTIFICLYSIQIAAATTWYVKKTGSNSNCTTIQTETTPAVTLGFAMSCARSAGGTGNVVEVIDTTAVTYVESLDNVQGSGLPSGTSASPFTFKARTRGIVTIQAPSGATLVLQIAYLSSHDIIVDGFILDGNNTALNVVKVSGASPSDFAHHITIRYVTAKNAQNATFIVAATDSLFQYIKCDTWGNGGGDLPKNNQCLYVQNARNIIEYAEMLGGTGPGIGFWYQNDPNRSSDNILRYSYIHDNALSNDGGVGAYSHGPRNQFYGNVIEGNGGCLLLSGNDNKAWDNTCYRNNKNGSDGTPDYEVKIDNPGAIVKNNILIRDTNQPGVISTPSPCTNCVISNNVCSHTTTGCSVVGDPLLVNPAANDFRLTSTSPAIGAGTSSIATGITACGNGGVYNAGAFKTFVFKTGTVNGNQMDLTFNPDCAPPIIPASGITGFTVNNGRTVTSAIRPAGTTNVIRLTFSGAACAAESWTFSYSGGNVSDSANIGNKGFTFSQNLFNITNRAVTNQCGGGTPNPPGTPHIHYTFADGSGTNANDETANNLDGTLAGTSVPVWGTGIISFNDLVDDRVDVPYGNGIDPTTQSLTICQGVVIPIGAASAVKHIFGSATGTNQRINIQTDSGSWKMAIRVGTTTGPSQFPVVEGANHVCLRLDSSTDIAHLFVNGVKGTDSHTQKSYTTFTTASNFAIGMSSGLANGSSLLPGITFDYWKLFTSALTDTQINEEFAAWQPPSPSPSGGTFTQLTYRWYLLREYQGSLIKLPSPASPVNSSIFVSPNSSVVLESQIDCTLADCAAIASVLEYDVDGNNVYTQLGDNCGNEFACFYGNSDPDPAIPSGVPPCPLSGALTCIDGGTQRTSAAVPNFDLAQNNSIVLRDVIFISASAGKTLRFRRKNQTGSLFTYTQQGTVTTVLDYAGSL